MQNETEKTIEEYISMAPETIKNFIASGDWKNDAKNIADKFKLTEENTNDFKNEIIFVLIGMEPRKDFAENVGRELGIDSNMANWIAEEVEKSIFAKVSVEIDSMWQNENLEQKENLNQNNVGSDFEQIILNQARAMQPAREAPQNLPTENSEPKVIHNYIGKSDPYREPAE